MKHFSILEPPSKEFVEIAVRQKGWDLEKFKDLSHFQEDYFIVSKKYPIFVVADGVTLEVDKNGNYPNPSGAGEVARVFCEKIIEYGEKYYDQFDESFILKIFKGANESVGIYNWQHGRTKEAINFWDFDLFAATGVFVVVKDKTVYWASICDSFVMHFDKNNSNIFRSPECWPNTEKNLPPNWKNIEFNERKKIIRKIYRNGINEKEELTGYGVITGEETAGRYLNYGKFSAEEGDLVALLTDGFSDYMTLSQFIPLLRKDYKEIESSVKQFTAVKSKENPEKFGHERTLIMILF